MDKAQEILNFWFGNLEENKIPPKEITQLWFMKNKDFDKKIEDTYLDTINKAYNDEYKSWEENPQSILALIILFDQFPRNIFRGTEKAFFYDNKALELSLKGIENRFDKKLHPVQRTFFYLPLEHSENIKMQELCLEVFDELISESPENLKNSMGSYKEYAIKHYEIIKRFNRFPHRNDTLGRVSTKEEIEFLKTPGSSF